MATFVKNQDVARYLVHDNGHIILHMCYHTLQSTRVTISTIFSQKMPNHIHYIVLYKNNEMTLRIHFRNKLVYYLHTKLSYPCEYKKLTIYLLLMFSQSTLRTIWWMWMLNSKKSVFLLFQLDP